MSIPRDALGRFCKDVTYTDRGRALDRTAPIAKLQSQGIKTVAGAFTQEDLADMFLGRQLEPHEELTPYAYMGHLCCDLSFPLMREAVENAKRLYLDALEFGHDSLRRGVQPKYTVEHLSAFVTYQVLQNLGEDNLMSVI